MNSNSAVLFLDTNILLHFKSVREVDWQQVVGAREVRLVLCSPVLDELDERKYDPKTADRAKTVLGELEDIEKADGRLRDSVRLDMATDDEEPSGGNTDLAIIERVKEYAEKHTEERVAIASDDLNMRNRCKARGVECIRLDDEWRRPPNDESSTKIRKLEQEVQRLRNMRPKLRLLAATGSDQSRDECVDIVLQHAAAGDIQRMLEGVVREYPKLPDYSTEHARYNTELDRFYTKYLTYLEKMAAYQEKLALMFELTLWGDNRGTCPAENVEINIHLPERFFLIVDNEDVKRYLDSPARRYDPKMDSVFSLPAEPAPPEKPRRKSVMRVGDYVPNLGSPLDLDHMLASTLGNIHRSSEVTGNDMKLWARSIKHNKAELLATMTLVFKDWNSVSTFEAPYEILADNHPDITHGKLVIRTRVEGR